MQSIKFIKEKTKEVIQDYLPEKKRETSLTERSKQKQKLERASQLLDLDLVKTRKLTLEFSPSTKQQKHQAQQITREFNNDYYSEHNTDFDDLEEKIENSKIEHYAELFYENQNKPQTHLTQKIKQELNQEKNSNIKKIEPFQEVIQYFKQRGVVGEETLALKIFLAASNNMSFGVEGYSGSGKTFVVDKLIDLINTKELYRLDLSSKMAVFYDSKNINNYKTIYIPELQKALQETKSPIVEVIKNLTEGKDVKRIVTDNKKRGNKTYNITNGKSIIYTLASENYFKKDEELNRRFLRFKTDNTEEHLEAILNYKADKRENLLFEENNPELESGLKQKLFFLRNLDVNIFDPYSSHIINYLPKTQKCIGYIDHYFSLVNASAKLNYEHRLKFIRKDKKIIATNLEDHYLIHKIYYLEFIETLKGFSERNNLEEELSAIEEIETKKINWTEAQKHGLKKIRTVLEPYFEEYITINNNTTIETLSEKYKVFNNQYED